MDFKARKVSLSKTIQKCQSEHLNFAPCHGLTFFLLWMYWIVYSVHCNAQNIYYLINLNFSLNILIKNSDKRPLRTKVRYFQNPNSDKNQIRTSVRFGHFLPVTGKKCMKRVENKYSLGVQPHFFPITPKFGFGDGKMEKGT